MDHAHHVSCPPPSGSWKEVPQAPPPSKMTMYEQGMAHAQLAIEHGERRDPVQARRYRRSAIQKLLDCLSGALDLLIARGCVCAASQLSSYGVAELTFVAADVLQMSQRKIMPPSRCISATSRSRISKMSPRLRAHR